MSGADSRMDDGPDSSDGDDHVEIMMSDSDNVSERGGHFEEVDDGLMVLSFAPGAANSVLGCCAPRADHAHSYLTVLKSVFVCGELISPSGMHGRYRRAKCTSRYQQNPLHRSSSP